MDAPAETVARSGGKYLVLLRVIEVFNIESGLVLAERRLRQGAFAVRLERPQIMLQAGHQRDVAGAATLAQTIEQIADHPGVDADILRFRILPQPSGDEHRVGAQVG